LGDLLNPKFWIASLVLVLILGFTGRRRTVWFGGLNLLVVLAWLGWPVAVAAAGFSACFWWLLWLAARKPLKGTPTGIVVLVVVAMLFLLHKINIEYHEPAQDWIGGGPWGLPASVLVPLAALTFSYVALRAYDMAFSVLFQRAPLLDALSTAGYLFPFHMLLSGPIASYAAHVKCNTDPLRDPMYERLLRAGNEISTGLVYKYVISEYMRAFAYGAGGQLQIDGYWDTVYLLIYTFFDFAGYSRIVMGIGRLMGIPTPENFRMPFLARTATDFFTRWHISLGSFIKRDVYTPLQLHLVRRWGLRRAVWAGLLALMVSWIVVGLWHRVSVVFLVYGLILAGWIWLEKLVRDRALKYAWSRTVAARWATAILGPPYVFFTLCAVLHIVAKEILGQ